jgi:hypothetical protein
MKRINFLLLTEKPIYEPHEISDDDIKRSAIYTETSTKLVTTERQLQEMRLKLDERNEQWAIARGDADSAAKSLEENLAKHKKRWSELTGEEDSENGGDHDNMPDERVYQAKQIAELEHKLNQALENVRQADTVRDSLETAISMNESLTVKLEQIKVKHASEMACAGKTEQSLVTASLSVAKETPNKEKIALSTPTLDASKAEKMYKEHRRMRKEVDAARASKEAAKARQEVSVI